MIIDANKLVLGRMASYVAKKALLGDKIEVVDCENCIVVGKKSHILGAYKKRFQRGVHTKGPFFPRMPDKLVRRAIRGMLPYNIEKGKKAFKNVRCHIGIPQNLKNEKIEALNGLNTAKSGAIDYVSIREICKSLGGR